MKHIFSRSTDNGSSASPILDIDVAELNRLLAKLPTKPDEKLR